MTPNNGARAFKALYELMQSQKPWVAERVSTFDLTIYLSHAMYLLARDGEMTMSAFAAMMYVDASNATGIVDRLEARGLVERIPAEHDRRAKVVRLTAAGKRLERRVDELMMREAPPPIARLSAAEQRTLREILERAVALAGEEADDPKSA
jgi:DNA-binding MarR family transcriptional regulator